MGKESIRPLVVVVCAGGPTPAAGHRTANFLVRPESAEVARKIGEAVERYRKKFALQ